MDGTTERAAGVVRPFSELRSSGLLWLINAAALHPRGYALALHYDDADEPTTPTGWSLVGDGEEPWTFADDCDGEFRAVAALLEETRLAAFADAAAEREEARYQATRAETRACDVTRQHKPHTWPAFPGGTGRYGCPGAEAVRCPEETAHLPHTWVAAGTDPRVRDCPGLTGWCGKADPHPWHRVIEPGRVFVCDRPEGTLPADTRWVRPGGTDPERLCEDPGGFEAHGPHRWTPHDRPDEAYACPGLTERNCRNPVAHDPHLYGRVDERPLPRCPGVVPCGDSWPHLSHGRCAGVPGWCGQVSEHNAHDVRTESPGQPARVYRCPGGAVRAAEAMGARRVAAVTPGGLADAAVTGFRTAGTWTRPPAATLAEDVPWTVVTDSRIPPGTALLGPPEHIERMLTDWTRASWPDRPIEIRYGDVVALRVVRPPDCGTCDDTGFTDGDDAGGIPEQVPCPDCPAGGIARVAATMNVPYEAIDPKPGLTGNGEADLAAIEAWTRRRDEHMRSAPPARECDDAHAHPAHRYEFGGTVYRCKGSTVCQAER